MVAVVVVVVIVFVVLSRPVMVRPGVRQVPEGSREQDKMDETSCEIICDASTTLAVKG